GAFVMNHAEFGSHAAAFPPHQLLPVLGHPPLLVIVDYDGDRQVVLRRGMEFREIEPRRSVADDAENLLVGMRRLAREREREAGSQASEITMRQESSRVACRPRIRHPGGGLATVGDDDRVGLDIDLDHACIALNYRVAPAGEQPNPRTKQDYEVGVAAAVRMDHRMNR